MLGGYNSAAFFNVMIPMSVIISAVLTLLAVIGIWEKDRPEFFGVGGTKDKVKLKEYAAILKANKELQRLMGRSVPILYRLSETYTRSHKAHKTIQNTHI